MGLFEQCELMFQQEFPIVAVPYQRSTRISKPWGSPLSKRLSNNRMHLTRAAPASVSRLRRGPCRLSRPCEADATCSTSNM